MAPAQATGVRRSRWLPYSLDAALVGDTPARIEFRNTGQAGAVFHVHDLQRPDAPPRRYTVAALQVLADEWPAGDFDLQVTGPNGFHRRFRSGGGVLVSFTSTGLDAKLSLTSVSPKTIHLDVTAGAYSDIIAPWNVNLKAGASTVRSWNLSGTHGWYDFVVGTRGRQGREQRLAGRIESREPSVSDPAMGGAAVMSWS